MPRGNYCAKTVKEKVEILRKVDQGNSSKYEIARKHGIPPSTLSTYIRNRTAIENAYEAEDFGASRKRLRTAKFPELESALIIWVKEMRAQSIALSGPIIMAKAADFALRLDIEDFVASEGWFHRFRERHNLVFRTLSGEAKEVDAETCATWRSDTLQQYLESYSPQDVFNADETALFFKLQPDKTITYKGDSCAGGKRSKERVTVLVAANMTGTEKVPLFVIGKALKPRCFKNIRSLPTEYAANKKAWMTGDLFRKWLLKFDRRMELGGRRVLLVVDNCSAHKVDVELRATKLVFLPANTTAALQPMDQGVIRNIKCFYRRHVLERMILCAGDRKDFGITLLTAMHMLVRAWEQVTATTIANCFRHSGFAAGSAQDSCDVDVDGAEELMPVALRDTLRGVRFADYVEVDTGASVCGALTDEDIIAQVAGAQPDAEEPEGEEDENDEAPVRPSASAVMEALNVARLFFSFEEGEEDSLRRVRALEQRAAAVAFREKKQMVITDFFGQ